MTPEHGGGGRGGGSGCAGGLRLPSAPLPTWWTSSLGSSKPESCFFTTPFTPLFSMCRSHCLPDLLEDFSSAILDHARRCSLDPRKARGWAVFPGGRAGSFSRRPLGLPRTTSHRAHLPSRPVHTCPEQASSQQPLGTCLEAGSRQQLGELGRAETPTRRRPGSEPPWRPHAPAPGRWPFLTPQAWPPGCPGKGWLSARETSGRSPLPEAQALMWRRPHVTLISGRGWLPPLLSPSDPAPAWTLGALSLLLV